MLSKNARNINVAAQYAKDMPPGQRDFISNKQGVQPGEAASGAAFPCSQKNNVPVLNRGAKKRGVPEVFEAGAAKKEGMQTKVNRAVAVAAAVAVGFSRL